MIFKQDHVIKDTLKHHHSPHCLQRPTPCRFIRIVTSQRHSYSFYGQMWNMCFRNLQRGREKKKKSTRLITSFIPAPKRNSDHTQEHSAYRHTPEESNTLQAVFQSRHQPFIQFRLLTHWGFPLSHFQYLKTVIKAE